MRLLHVAQDGLRFPFSGDFRAALESVGEFTIIEHAASLEKSHVIDIIQNCDVLLTGWGSAPVPEDIAVNPGRLRYICNVTGEMRGFVPLSVIRAGIPVTNWGNAPANLVAEGAMTLLLAVMKDLQTVHERVKSGEWGVDETVAVGGTLRGLGVGIYGMGVIGRRFVELIRPFGSHLRVYDPYVSQIPANCTVASSLAELFASSHAVVIHAGLTEETRHSVTAELLALLPDGGIVINTARGSIIDEEALFAELSSGRLRAGLDVLDGADRLEPSHPARGWANLVLTGHQIDRSRWPSGQHQLITEAQQICLENLQRFIKEEPLHFVMDEERYLLST